VGENIDLHYSFSEVPARNAAEMVGRNNIAFVGEDSDTFPSLVEIWTDTRYNIITYECSLDL